MWETRAVDLRVRLPRDVAAQATVVQREDPEFLSRVVLYGLTRRSIYRYLSEREEEPTNARGEPLTEHELAVLSENAALDDARVGRPYESLDEIPDDVRAGLDAETEALIAEVAVPPDATESERLAALVAAVVEYDEALRLRAQFGRKQATGDDLDALYATVAGRAYEARRWIGG